jgi:hypothetical protein
MGGGREDGGQDEREQIDQAVAGELRLHRPEVRTSRELAGELLDPAFVEVGKSGRRWDREAMLAELPSMTSEGPETAIEVRDMSGVLLAPGLVHLTYATEVGGLRALRSALWRRDGEGRWRTFYHQGTPAAD